MPEIDITTLAGETWTILIAARTTLNLDALRRAAADHGFRAHLAELLWDPDRLPPTSEAQIGGYLWETVDKLATALEADLLACPAAWECVCGTLNRGQWRLRDMCRGCRMEASKPSQVAAHYRMVPPPSENGVLARMLETARARRHDGMVTVSRADLDLVMNHAGDPTTVAEYPAAAQRIHDALEGGQRG